MTRDSEVREPVRDQPSVERERWSLRRWWIEIGAGTPARLQQVVEEIERGEGRIEVLDGRTATSTRAEAFVSRAARSA